jgi:hypothetical protein
MKKNPALESVVDELESNGVLDYSVIYGRHIKIKWPSGMVTVSQSASDVRAARNARGDVRRQLRRA